MSHTKLWVKRLFEETELLEQGAHQAQQGG